MLPKQSAPLSRAEAIAKRVAKELGYSLIEAELVKEPTGRFLRFYIDKPDGVSIDDCESFHRRIHPMMDDIDYDYMEVSSPGADRPLKSEADFVRAQGETVEVKLYKPQDGSKLYQGVLLGLLDGRIEIEDMQGMKWTFDKKEVALVRPLIEFEESDLDDDIPVDAE